MRRDRRNSVKSNKIVIFAVAAISIILVTIIGIYTINKINSAKTVEVASVNAKQNNLKIEEVIPTEVTEQIIIVAQDKEEEQEEEKEDEEVKQGDLTVKVPKSKVAAVNSAEDAEKNKKNGGANVSQSEVNSMFENVGTKSFGIDVSAHQGIIDWNAVRNSGIDFAIIRCGFRGQSQGAIYEDAYFKRNMAGAAAAGVKIGIYFYSTAVNETEALEEAAWVVRKISTYGITYPVVYDFEDFGAYRCSGVNGAQATSNALTFLNHVRANGYEPMMYANKSDITSRLSRGSFNCKFWLAHYTSQTDYAGSYQMWQYTSKGSVPGISGHVDMDIAYFSYGKTASALHTHNFNELVKNSTKEPQCMIAGSKVMRCACGETETQTIPNPGHKLGEWKIEKKATTQEAGLRVRKCEKCSYKEEQVIEVLKDTNTVANNVAAQTGNTVNTNTSANENKVPEEHTHSFVETGNTIKAATCEEKGSVETKCSCEKTSSKEIPAKGHDYNQSTGKCNTCGKEDPTFVKEETKPEEDGNTITENE